VVINLAGLPKKYAKMGFKRGWAAYKKTKRTRTVRRSAPRRKVRTVSRRRSYKRVYRRARTAGGKQKAIIDGLMAGAAAAILPRFINMPMADDLAYLAVGYFRNNNTLKTIGGAGLASDLLSGGLGGFTLGGGGTNGGGYL